MTDEMEDRKRTLYHSEHPSYPDITMTEASYNSSFLSSLVETYNHDRGSMSHVPESFKPAPLFSNSPAASRSASPTHTDDVDAITPPDRDSVPYLPPKDMRYERFTGSPAPAPPPPPPPPPPPKTLENFRPDSVEMRHMFYDSHSPRPSVESGTLGYLYSPRLTSPLALNNNTTTHPPPPPPTTTTTSSLRTTTTIYSTHRTRIRGKQYLNYTRITLTILAALTSLLSVILSSTSLSQFYLPGRTLSKPLPSSPPIYAWPQSPTLLPNYLELALGILGALFYITASFAPCWRSKSEFYRERYTKSEIYEIAGHSVLAIAYITAVYLTLNLQSSTPSKSLLAFSCLLANATSSNNPKEYPQIALFPDLNYSYACVEFKAANVLVMATMAGSIAVLITFAAAVCLEKKVEERKGLERMGRMRGGEGRRGCCGGFVPDCSICCFPCDACLGACLGALCSCNC